MGINDYGLDLDYRLCRYFWPLRLEWHLLATIKGEKRREVVGRTTTMKNPKRRSRKSLPR